MAVLSTKQERMTATRRKSNFPLEDIPGIGPKIRTRLLDYFQSEAASLQAIKMGTVGCVPGISYKQALRFAQTYFQLEQHITSADILKTPDIFAIYTQLLDIIGNYAQTEFSKLKLRQYFPLPLSKQGLIKENQDFFGKALAFVQKYGEDLEANNFMQFCSELNQLKQAEDLPKINSRIILSDSKQVQIFIENEDLTHQVHFEMINLTKITDAERFFQKYCLNFDVVIYCGTQIDKIPDYSNLILIPPNEVSISSLVPEQIIRIFAYNKSVIQAMIKIVVKLKTLKEPVLLQIFEPEFDLKQIRTLKENTKILDESGEILPRIDPKLDEYRDIFNEFDSLISETEQWINGQIQKEIGERSINIEGKQILDLMRTDLDLQQIRTYIPPEVDSLIEESLNRGITELGDQLKLDKFDRELLSSLIPEIIGYPVELNPQKIDELEQKISARLNVYKYSAMVEIAKELNETYQYLLKLHQILLEFDFFYMVGRFAHEYHLSIPSLVSKNRGFYGRNMVNLDLYRDYLHSLANSNKPSRSKKGSKKASSHITHDISPPIPITYKIGDIENALPLDTGSNSLSLLTGSNSGGKTMCLLTCAQAIILAQMGFPSVGEFTFCPFDELYYFKKSSGQLSAGAFETTLLQFVTLAQSSAQKIVFADELESITEPNAASKVLAGIFSLFLEKTENHGIFVTHLAEMLQREFTPEQRQHIRIDGIEAQGLDENLNLIVDRNPKFNFIAKSTPELILTRLSKSGSSDQQKFFQVILQKFHS